jgi:CubicO group peptidase (beta-lactamase class C family)
MWLGTIKLDLETLRDVRSVTKSIISLLFGIAMADHAIVSLDSPVLDYFPEYKDLQTSERRKIRLKDLLPMTSGLHWDEWSNLYGDVRNNETAMDLAADRYWYILSRPIDSQPGTQWWHSGGDAALIAAVMASTKVSIDEYAAKKLFAPWALQSLFGLRTAREFPLRRLAFGCCDAIGLLMLHSGRHPSAHQIVPESWIPESTSPRVTAFKENNCVIKYGYFWWLGTGCRTSPVGQPKEVSKSEAPVSATESCWSSCDIPYITIRRRSLFRAAALSCESSSMCGSTPD